MSSLYNTVVNTSYEEPDSCHVSLSFESAKVSCTSANQITSTVSLPKNEYEFNMVLPSLIAAVRR